MVGGGEGHESVGGCVGVETFICETLRGEAVEDFEGEEQDSFTRSMMFNWELVKMLQVRAYMTGGRGLDQLQLMDVKGMDTL